MLDRYCRQVDRSTFKSTYTDTLKGIQSKHGTIYHSHHILLFDMRVFNLKCTQNEGSVTIFAPSCRWKAGRSFVDCKTFFETSQQNSVVTFILTTAEEEDSIQFVLHNGRLQKPRGPKLHLKRHYLDSLQTGCVLMFYLSRYSKDFILKKVFSSQFGILGLPETSILPGELYGAV